MTPHEPLVAEAGERPSATLRLGPSSTAPIAPVEDQLGRVLGGRYEILREVGRGGMGIVYLARHIALGRSVAVKVLRPELARHDDALARFEREARAVAALGAPGIVEVLDFGREPGGEAWMVMEFLEGESLAARIRREGALPEAFVRTLLREVALALHEAHAKGIVHRDLKSENIVIVRRGSREVIKVVDFGISRVAAEPGDPVPDDAMVGTPHYMAPELGDPRAPSDHRADLYALGCIAFEALTARLPFAGSDPATVLALHRSAAVPRPRDHVRLSRALDAIVRRLLAKHPEDRFADTAALLDALSRAAGRRFRLPLGALVLLAAVVGARAAWPRAPVSARVSAPVPAPSPGQVSLSRSPREVVAPQGVTTIRVEASIPAAPAPRAVPRGRVLRSPPLHPDAGTNARPLERGPDNLMPSPYGTSP